MTLTIVPPEFMEPHYDLGHTRTHTAVLIPPAPAGLCPLRARVSAAAEGSQRGLGLVGSNVAGTWPRPQQQL